MADQKTEKPTKKRLEQSREEGRFAVSREFIGSLQLITFLCLAQWMGNNAFVRSRELIRGMLESAFRHDLHPSDVIADYRGVLFSVFVPLGVAGTGVALSALVGQLITTGLGFAPKKLMPDISRLSPLQKLKSIPKQNFTSMLYALALLPVFGLVIYLLVKDSILKILLLPLLRVEPGALQVLALVRSFLWRAAGVILIVGCIDFFRQKQKHAKSLRMSKQELREESKESEGNPQIKARVRRIQRDLARRNMMKEAATATAVVVNPTHFSVAIRYDLDSMAAPKVVAKGKNYLAARIKQIALENQIPIVENAPLAQALYKSVDVGQDIPAHLYRAVAEILAYIYRLTRPARA